MKQLMNGKVAKTTYAMLVAMGVTGAALVQSADAKSPFRTESVACRAGQSFKYDTQDSGWQSIGVGHEPRWHKIRKTDHHFECGGEHQKYPWGDGASEFKITRSQNEATIQYYR